MSVQRQPVPDPKDSELEATAELPVLDVAAYEAALSEERAGSTDTWHMPAIQSPPAGTTPPAVADDRTARLEVDLHALSDNLRDVEERLTRKGERLIELERELANARAERIALDERSAALISAAEERAKAAIAAAEARAATITAAAESRAASAAAAADERAAAATAAAQAQAASVTTAAQERTASLTAELGALRAELSTEQARVAALQSALDERESTVRDHESRDSERGSLLVARNQELANARRDLRELEARAAGYLESLHTLEGRRVIFDGQLLGLDSEVRQRDVHIARLEEELATHSSSERDLARDLTESRQRVAVREREVSALAASLAQRNIELEHSERARAKLADSVNSLTQTLAARTERIRELEAGAASHSATFTEHLQEIERLTQERTSIAAKVTSLEASLASAHSMVEEKEKALRGAAASRGDLEKRLAASQLRTEELDRDLVVARAEVAERMSATLRLEAERDEQINRSAAAEARAVELERRADEHAENIRLLQEELRATLARGTELEGDLHAAEDALNRLETELRNKSTKLEELAKTQEEWRSTIESARMSLAERESLIHRLETEAANSAALLGNIQQSIKRLDPAGQSGTHEIATEGAVRLLIRTDGDSEVVHVLGRKTTVGRTPDNDLQIDAKFISRNHAVILAGPNHTIIEDLNSTNGVAINGRRISRHTLRDGDSVAIGKTTFRFAVRPMAERR